MAEYNIVTLNLQHTKLAETATAAVSWDSISEILILLILHILWAMPQT